MSELVEQISRLE